MTGHRQPAMTASRLQRFCRTFSTLLIQVRPASFRTIRGLTCVASLNDEIAYLRSEDSANPDREVLQALRPSLATTGGPLICISSPHAKRGELYNTFKRHFGPEGHPLVLVAKAPSWVMNPSLPQSVVDRAFEADPEAASAEYMAEFRNDISAFISRDAIEAAVPRGVTVRAPLDSVTYFAFCDPSGGSSDSMTLALGHRESDRAVLDAIAERKAPFSPDAVVTEFADLLKAYGVNTVRGDRYAGAWPRERFAAHGIAYEPADLNRSELYLAFLPILNSGRADLLDNERMVTQFAGLERRTSRSGRDTVDHGVGSQDDVSNAVAGVLVMAQGNVEPGFIAYMREMAGIALEPEADQRIVRVLAPLGISHAHLWSGRQIVIPADRVVEMTAGDARPLFAGGWQVVT